MPKSPTLATIRAALRKRHGDVPPPPTDDPFELVLWEQVAYLADDENRRAAFELLEMRVGLAPEKVARAKPSVLLEVARAGGSIAADQRAERMRASARRVLDDFGGDLRAALALPVAEAVRELRKFPMIGKPGAEKILLLTRTTPVLALDSNAMRVLVRFGYGEEHERYDRTYASVREATAPEEKKDCDWLISLTLLLRIHGRTVCRDKAPACGECPLARDCAFP